MSFRAQVKTFAKARLSEQYATSLGGILLAIAPVLFLSFVLFLLSFLRDFIIFYFYTTYPNAFYAFPPFSGGTSFLHMQFSFLLFSLSMIFTVISYFLLPFSNVGRVSLSLSVARRQKASVLQPYRSGAKNYLRKLGGMLWMALFIFLWSLLFVVPGIIKAYSYRFTPYILADCPNVKARDALKLSMRMTDGIKGEIFLFDLSFLGWFVLTALTCGILAIYTAPYFFIAEATLYESMKNSALSSNRICEEDLFPAKNAPFSHSPRPYGTF